MIATAKRIDPRPAAVREKAIAVFEARMFAVARDGFTQLPYLSVSEWASQNRILQGSEAGKFNVDRCRYQTEIMDAFTDDEVREISWQAAERTGKSTVASNILGFCIDRNPCGILWVGASRESVGDFLKDEVEAMVRESIVLQRKMSAGRVGTGKTSNIRRKTFAGGVATFVGAGSPAPLASKTCRVVILDEIDKFPILKGEGDPDLLAAKRASTFGFDGKVLRFSKPSEEGASRIARHFERGSQGRYFHACPGCNEFSELAWASLRFDDVLMRCVHCDEFFDQDTWLAQPGEWRHAVQKPHHRSFQCSILVSPLTRWESLIEEYVTATRALQEGDDSLIRVFENSRLGKTYSGRIEKLEGSEIYERREIF